MSAISSTNIEQAESVIQRPVNPHVRLLKIAIWTYFILLVFEGALRKWIVPGLSTPLLLVRDPIALFILLYAYKHRQFPNSFYIRIMMLMGVVSILTTLATGHGNIMVAIYGARTIMVHFPLMFVIGHIFEKEDVEKIGKAVLWISIPMALIIAMQFFSPQTAWINRGVGGNTEGAGFSGSGEFFRPSGTFSFTNGLVLYFSLVCVFVFYFFIQADKIKKYLLIASAFSLLVAIPFSISRTLLFNFIIELMMMVIAVSRNSKHIYKIITLFGIGVIALGILSQTEFFQVSTGAFTDRFETANDVEGGLENVFVDRFLGGMLKALTESTEQPFFGMGIGMGSNVGAQLLMGNSNVFLISEEEWGRIIGEMGPLLGILLIFIRLQFATSMALKSFKVMHKENFLPWMLIGVSFILLLQGQWAQPTSLGFSAILGGLMLSGFRTSQNN